jgi:uncharacterized repeat protein (TIGR03803 family)
VSEISLEVRTMRNRLNLPGGPCLAIAFVLLLTATARAQYTNLCAGGGACSDGAYAYAGLIADAQGNLYGTPGIGGANNSGTVFELSPPSGGAGPWTETALYGAAASGGTSPKGALRVYRSQRRGNPNAGVIFDSQPKNRYGATQTGGSHNHGTVFELIPPSGGHRTTD